MTIHAKMALHNSQRYRLKPLGYRCESGIAIFARRVT